jgi:hypothetical protein
MGLFKKKNILYFQNIFLLSSNLTMLNYVLTVFFAYIYIYLCKFHIYIYRKFQKIII